MLGKALVSLLTVASLAVIATATVVPPTVTPLAGHPGLYVVTTYMKITTKYPPPNDVIVVPYVNNLFSVGADGIVLFDTHQVNDTDATEMSPPGPTTFTPMYPVLRSALSTVSSANVSIIINSHWHPDHIGLNAEFHRHGTNRIIAADGVLEAMQVAHYMPDMEMVELQHVWPADPAGYPTESVKYLKVLIKNNEVFTLIPLPDDAHSGNDLMTRLLWSNVLVCGDIFIPNSFPFIDRSSGGTLDGLIRAARYLLLLTDDDTVLITSHGDLSKATRTALHDYIHMLETANHRLQDLVAQGLTEQQVLDRKPLADFEAVYGQGFFSSGFFIKVVYRVLTNAP